MIRGSILVVGEVAGSVGSMASEQVQRFESVQMVRDGLRDLDYLADDGIAGVAYLADRLGKPVLVEMPQYLYNVARTRHGLAI